MVVVAVVVVAATDSITEIVGTDIRIAAVVVAAAAVATIKIGITVVAIITATVGVAGTVEVLMTGVGAVGVAGDIVMTPIAKDRPVVAAKRNYEKLRQVIYSKQHSNPLRI